MLDIFLPSVPFSLAVMMGQRYWLLSLHLLRACIKATSLLPSSLAVCVFMFLSHVPILSVLYVDIYIFVQKYEKYATSDLSRNTAYTKYEIVSIDPYIYMNTYIYIFYTYIYMLDIYVGRLLPFTVQDSLYVVFMM